MARSWSPLAREAIAAVVVGDGVSWDRAGSPGVVGDGAVVVALGRPGVSRGCRRQRRASGRAGSPGCSRRWRGRSPLGAPGAAAVVVVIGQGLIARELVDRTAPHGGGAGVGPSLIAVVKSAMARSKSPLPTPGEAAVVVGTGVFRVEPDRLVVVGDGAVVIAFFVPGEGAAVVSDSAIFLALASVIDDTRAGRDGAIGVVAVAIIPVLLAGGEGRRGGEERRERNHSKSLPTHVVSRCAQGRFEPPGRRRAPPDDGFRSRPLSQLWRSGDRTIGVFAGRYRPIYATTMDLVSLTRRDASRRSPPPAPARPGGGRGRRDSSGSG